jgi:hypothetical protein
MRVYPTKCDLTAVRYTRAPPTTAHHQFVLNLKVQQSILIFRLNSIRCTNLRQTVKSEIGSTAVTNLIGYQQMRHFKFAVLQPTRENTMPA